MTSFITIEGFDGTEISIRPSRVIRFKEVTYGSPSEGMKLDYVGGVSFSQESPEGFKSRINDLLVVVEFSLRGGATVWVNPALVGEIRPALPINGPGTELEIAGRYQHVAESYTDVMQILRSV